MPAGHLVGRLTTLAVLRCPACERGVLATRLVSKLEAQAAIFEKRLHRVQATRRRIVNKWTFQFSACFERDV